MAARTDYRLSKREKLCSPADIDALFTNSGGSQAFIAYPLRVVWRINTRRRDPEDTTTKFLISIPKRRLRHAVDRVRMRRLVREAYRLGREALSTPTGTPVDIAFIFVDSALHPYSDITHAMQKALVRITQQLSQE
ncbi:MAG: ribonuclease P protein component [Muribaculum sp.]|nr:ribonuclease P protein component [Muribaculum sp.]